MTGRYDSLYARAMADPDGFWREAARAIDWVRPPDRIFDPALGVYGRWFPDAIVNTCWNCVDRHVPVRGDQVAIVHDSPVTGTVRKITYRELLASVQAMAAVLGDAGVGRGDRVVVYMPMIPEALITMLACARIGAIHSVVFGGFAANELATRIDDAQPTVIVAASCGVEPSRVVPYMPLVDGALTLARHRVGRVLVWQRERQPATLDPDRDEDVGALHAQALAAGRTVPCAELAATDPLYILYTSGTTGIPKGVVRDNGGHLVALAWSMKGVFGVDPGETFWTASDVGWVVGHSYSVYGPLIHGATTLVYGGKPVGTPDAGAFWRVVADHGVRVLFTAPTSLRAIKKEDPAGALVERYDLSSLRALFLAGERADPPSLAWAEATFGLPVIDNWWQTETGWPIAANPLGVELLPIKPGSPTKPMPGYDLRVVDDAGEPVAPGTLGNIVIKLPLPPGCLPTLWQDDARFRESYLDRFPGSYTTSDAGIIDADGYISIMSRTDDIINVAGHRLSTGAMEEVLASHPDVGECAVIGVADEIKGQVPCGFVVLKSGAARKPSEIEAELVALVRERIGPVAALRTVLTVERLPKTRSGKILRGTMRQIADSGSYRMPATIEDPAVLGEIEAALGRRRAKAAASA